VVLSQVVSPALQPAPLERVIRLIAFEFASMAHPMLQFQQGGMFGHPEAEHGRRRRVMKTLFDNESSAEVTKAMSITGGWLLGWTGILLLLVLV
jgi:hypothetical protein